MSNTIKRASGLLIIEVVNSNPNGDPDRDSDPRQRPDKLGEISPVSYKRKLRDTVDNKVSPVWAELKQAVTAKLKIKDGDLKDDDFGILEKRGRVREDIEQEVYDGKFNRKYWDARVFGNTFLENVETIKERLKKKNEKMAEKDLTEKAQANLKKFRANIKAGVVQFGMGISIKPINIRRHSETNKPGVEEGTEQGFAPLGCRYVTYGVYAMPFFVNPHSANLTDCRVEDIELLLQLIPAAYPLNPSKVRPMVRVGMAHYIEHTSLLGSFPDFDVLRKLTPVASYPENPDAQERLVPKGTKTEWNKEAAKEFLKDYKFARYRELVSGLELGPNDLK
jgi:CRISPR-associated protein Csd2